VPRQKTISDEEILEHARALFLDRGFGASTLAIARRARISEALIFRRFRTKEALFAAALGLAEEPLWTAKLKALAGSYTLRNNLIAISLDIIDYYDAHLPRLMMIWSSRTRAPIRRQLDDIPQARNLRALSRYFEHEIELRRMRRVDPEVVARILLGALSNHSFAKAMGMRAEGRVAAKRYVTRLIGVLWQGIATPSSARGSSR
jgi:AcrR family transcriptional regulator